MLLMDMYPQSRFSGPVLSTSVSQFASTMHNTKLMDIPVAIGIIGATVMPHSIFLGSALATQDRLEGNYGPTDAARTRRTDTPDWGSAAPDSITDRYRPSFFSRFRTAFLELFRVSSIESMPNDPKSHAEHENKGYAFVRAHIYHGMVDITVSLLGIAVVINSM